MLSFVGGPQSMTYLFRLKDLSVNYPRNARDEDLLHESSTFQRSYSEATSMSYFLQRIRFADVCRYIVDTLYSSDTEIENMNYNKIITLDNRFEDFLNGLPKFLKLDEKNRRESAHTDMLLPQIPIQRYIINVNAHCRRIRLHQPFLIRRSLNHRYAYSREICLRSARAVISVKRLLDNDRSQFGSRHKGLFAIIHHLFLATVVLVMDLCFNLDEGQAEQQRTEVRDACRMLEECKSQSPMASKYLESLEAILRRHKIHLLNLPSGTATSIDQRPMSLGNGSLGFNGDGIEQDANQAFATNLTLSELDFDFDATWTEFIDLEHNLDVPNWDQLFADIDVR
jgi:hypothetical protein